MKRFNKLLGSAAIMCLAVSCSSKKDNNNNNGGCNNCGGNKINNQPGHALTVDLSGALGVLVTDPSQSGATLKLAEHNAKVKELNLVGAPVFDLTDTGVFNLDGASPGATGEKSLQKVTEAGQVLDVITDSAVPANNMGQKRQDLPKILTIAVSPLKDIFIHFERSFQYKEGPTDVQVDTWDATKGYQCQLFKVKGGTLETLTTAAPAADNLECVDNLHFIDSWNQGRSSVFQFDDLGNIYYRGSLPNGGGKAVVYKVSRDLQTRSEVINSNICVQDFLVTGKGSVFYTGNTCTNNTGGGGGNGGGFFRYVDPVADKVREIARDWWNFIFEPLVGTTNEAGNKAMFFGPNPNAASTASWDSACLFKFDPSKTDATVNGVNTDPSVTSVITCGSDINSWLNMSRAEDIKPIAEGGYGRGYQSGEQNPSTAWKTEFAKRCMSKGQVFAGGGSQITAIKQSKPTVENPDGTGYVIGNLRKKKEGEVTCNVSIKGPHCLINSIPYVGTGYDTQATCESATNTYHPVVSTALDGTKTYSAGTWTEGTGRCNIRLARLDYNWDSATNPRPPRTNDDLINPWYREITGKTKAECLALDLGDETLPDNQNPGSWKDGVDNATPHENVKPTQVGCTHDFTDGNSLGNVAGTYDGNDSPNGGDRRCAVGISWTYDQNTDYNGVASPLCNSAADADDAALANRRVTNIWDGANNVKISSDLVSPYDYTGQGTTNSPAVATGTVRSTLKNRFEADGITRNAAAYTAPVTSATKFSTNWMNCNAKGSTSNNGNWTDEYKSLAKVNTTTASLEMLSSESEQALNMWIVNNVAYYSSYDATAKKYRLQKATFDDPTHPSVVTRSLLADDMEIYNLSASESATKLYFDGLNFFSNTYEFGTIDLSSAGCGTATGCTRSATVGLTGTLKTIVILPK